MRRGQRDGSIAPGLDADDTGIELHALVSGLRTRSGFVSAPAVAADSLTLLEALRSASSQGA